MRFFLASLEQFTEALSRPLQEEGPACARARTSEISTDMQPSLLCAHSNQIAKSRPSFEQNVRAPRTATCASVRTQE